MAEVIELLQQDVRIWKELPLREAPS